ncbi:Na/Pi cotransporter family protein [Methylopila musalis]|uniref:Na/Pi cotransporter family protein n=1 Tax=Methylopila musalis TaxID=1134781 RepID=A0ABW3ZBK5_9HYPH
MDIFKDIIVPVIGGLGIFMLGLEFMSNGIQSLAVNRMRSVLGRVAGTPIKGLAAGTLITGVIQSSTAMTVMVVGLVNAGVMGLRPAISVIMGANIGTTLTNTLIALPLGLYGLLVAGFAALVYVFAKKDTVRNVALAVMGFALIFYGLSMMTGGLKPLRNIPEVMEIISTLNADTYGGILRCVITAALITAMIHSSSATIGIVMGLGASGVLDWQTALAFSLGADLGTTITSFIASLNLSKNAKRAAYAHISFNFIGVAVMLPLFPLACELLVYFIGDPGAPSTAANGEVSYPLVPIAVGVYSTVFNIFNTALLFPFIGVFERVLSRVGQTSADDVEDYSQPKFLDPRHDGALSTGLPAVQAETGRYLQAASRFIDIARGAENAPDDVEEHAAAMDILNREIRRYTSAMFRPELGYGRSDLLASLIEEEDFTASLGETLHQIARRVKREPFSAAGREIVDAMLARVEGAMAPILAARADGAPSAALRDGEAFLLEMREKTLRATTEIEWAERGAVLALLGSAERAFFLIDRIDAERRSVARVAPEEAAAPQPAPAGGLAPVQA